MLFLTTTQSEQSASSLEMLAPAFQVLRTRQKYGTRSYPTNSDYHTLVATLEAAGHDMAAVAAQRDWFQRGQTGCLFARMAALLDARAWPYLVWNHREFDALAALQLDAAIDQAAADDDVQMVSLLFPQCRTIEELRDITLTLEETSFRVDDITIFEKEVVFQVRRPVADGVDAWVMGFGPDPAFPETRRAPYFELALRVRKKPDAIYGRLNQDRDVAHLADFPLSMPDKHWDDRWDSTKRRTREILDHEPDLKSAAKSTFSIPLDD